MLIQEQFTSIQVQFLAKHKISKDLLFNARGIKATKEMLEKMAIEQKPIAYNTAPCENNINHTFKTNGGHCPQCRTVTIGFALREYKEGFIYIVGSLEGEMLKIGLTSDIEKRLKSLNGATSKYGNIADWQMLFFARTIKSGKVERMIHDKLSKFQHTREYSKSDGSHEGNELFRCSYTRAKEAIIDVQNENQIKFSMQREITPIIGKYEFRNLSRPLVQL
jgi:predicted GIY-YIG superfamily endonuclease